MTDENKIKSSLIETWSYDSQTQELEITFKSGSSFKYLGVSPDIISKVFDSPGSIGSKFIRFIRSNKRIQANKTQ
jgi:hypothetical protein